MPDELGTEQTLTDGGASSTDTATGSGLASEALAGASSGATQAEEFQPDPTLSPSANERIRQALAERDTYRQQAEAAKQFEPFAKLIETVKGGGFENADDFLAHISEQQRNAQVEAGIKAKIDARAAELLPALNSEQITEKYALEILTTLEKTLRLEAQQQVDGGRLQSLEMGQLRTKYPQMDDEYVRVLVQGGKRLDEAARISHQKSIQDEQRILAKYNGSKQADAAATGQQPLGTTGNAPVPKSLLEETDPVKFNAAYDALVAQRQAQRAGR